MPNIRSQRVSKDEIYIQASDGREWSITRAGVIALYQAQSGSAATRRQKTVELLIAQIVAPLGADQIAITDIFPDFDTADSTKAMLMSIGAALAPPGVD